VVEGLREVFESAGCVGQVRVEPIDGAHAVTLDAEVHVVAASVFKVQVALEVESQIARGDLDPQERCVIRSEDRTPGPTGISLFSDDAECSLRDLVTLMLTISDNAATDALLRRVGIDTVNEGARRLGMGSTVIEADLRTTIDSIGIDAGFKDYEALNTWLDCVGGGSELDRVAGRIRRSRAMTPSSANRTTASDMVLLMRRIWTDEAGPPGACAAVRSLMRRQLTRNRIAAAFPPPARVSAKSGGLMGIVRNEVGVVEHHGGTFFVAIFTEAFKAWTRDAEINAAIGEVARTSVESLLSE